MIRRRAFYVLSDILLYFDLLRPLGIFLAPLTTLLHLPAEAGPALIGGGGVLLNVYTAIAFAAPIGLTLHQWTILGVFIGICHSLLVECAIMARLGIATLYSVLLRLLGAFAATMPLVFLPISLGSNTGGYQAQVISRQFNSFTDMLLKSTAEALILSAKVIVLVCTLALLMDWIKSIPAVKTHIERVNTTFSIIVGQLLGITYGAGILLREANRGTLSRRDIFFIGTFLMICHSSIEDILVFVLFGANCWIILLFYLRGLLRRLCSVMCSCECSGEERLIWWCADNREYHGK